MRRVLPLLLALSLAAVPARAEPPIDLRITRDQRAAAHTGLAFGLGTQAYALTTTLVWALSSDGIALASTVPAWITSVPMSPAGIHGFEGTLRDGTVEGHHRGLGIGFLEGGLYSLTMGGIVGLGAARREVEVCSGPSTGGGFPPCFEDATPAFLIPSIITHLALGGVYTGVGLGMLERAKWMANRPQAMSALPTVSVTPEGARIGVVGVF